MSDELIDWTLAEAPGADESPPATASARRVGAPPRAVAIPRLTWLILGGLLSFTLLGLGGYVFWNNARLQREVRAVIAAEELAGGRGATREIGAYIDPTDPVWAAMQTRWVEHRQSAPLPAGGLQFVGQAGGVHSVTAFTADTARAEVNHQFRTPAGDTLTFTLPQFYHYNANGWKRRPPPATYWGEAKHLGLRYGELNYFSIDAAFIEKKLAPYLDNLLTQACREWQCRSDFRISIYFTADWPLTTHSDVTTALPANTPLLLELLVSTPTQWVSNSSLILPLPHLTGYPADDASAAWLKRHIALQVLAHASVRLAGSTRAANAFLYALTLRTLARLGLEAPAVLEFQSEPRYTADALWNGDGPDNPAEQVTFVTSALSIVNALLTPAAQPDLESRLWESLGNHTEVTAWLASAQRSSPNDAQAQLFTLSTALNPDLLNPADFEFALSCQTGPALLSLQLTATVPLLAGAAPGLFINSWSPDGENLTLSLNTATAVLQFGARRVMVVPGMATGYYPVGGYGANSWASDSVLAYLTRPGFESSIYDPTQFHLRFLDTTAPARQLPAFDFIGDYVPSPDKRWAAVMKLDADPGPAGARLALMPASGGDLTPLDSGWGPVWSPDSRAFTYIRTEPDSNTNNPETALGLAELAGPAQYTVVAGDTVLGIAARFNRPLADLLAANQLPNADAIQVGQKLTVSLPSDPVRVITRTLAVSHTLPGYKYFVGSAWSPDGQTIALLALDKNNGAQKAALALIPLTGETRILLTDLDAYWAAAPQFSPDGQYVGFNLYSNQNSAMALYNLRTGYSTIRPNTFSFAWVPHGHNLVAVSDRGVYFVQPNAFAQLSEKKLVSDSCYNILWNPSR